MESDQGIDKHTKITVGLALALMALLGTGVLQLISLKDDIREQVDAVGKQTAAAQTERAEIRGEIGVLNVKVDTLRDRMRDDSMEMRSRISSLEAEVKELAKRSP